MKKTILLTAGLVALAIGVNAAPAWVVGEGALNPAAGHLPEDTISMFTTIPNVVSATDMAHGQTAFLIAGSLNTFHGGSAMVPTAFLDGSGEVNYPQNIPNDIANTDPAGQVCLSLGIDLGGTVDVGSVIIYAYSNQNDSRGVAPYSVYTTTDTIPSASGSWTKILDYTSPGTGIAGQVEWYAASPANAVVDTNGSFWDPYFCNYDGTAMVCADDAGAALAANITGIRVDVYRAGVFDLLSSPLNEATNLKATYSPYIAEIDVLNLTDTQAFYIPGSSVAEWSLY